METLHLTKAQLKVVKYMTVHVNFPTADQLAEAGCSLCTVKRMWEKSLLDFRAEQGYYALTPQLSAYGARHLDRWKNE